MKIAIIYVSQTGNTEMAAELIEDGILEKYPFIEVKAMDIREGEVELKFLEECSGVIFGSPVYSRGQRAKRTCLHVHLVTAARV